MKGVLGNSQGENPEEKIKLWLDEASPLLIASAGAFVLYSSFDKEGRETAKINQAIGEICGLQGGQCIIMKILQREILLYAALFYETPTIAAMQGYFKKHNLMDLLSKTTYDIADIQFVLNKLCREGLLDYVKEEDFYMLMQDFSGIARRIIPKILQFKTSSKTSV